MKLEPLYTIRGPKTLYEMSWEEVQEALTETDIALVPVGAVEQHGPHLPLGSDSMQGIDFCRRLRLMLDEDGFPVVAGPPIHFGISSAHSAFPGTIALRPKTMLAVIEETCLCLYEHGFRRFALILGHGGNWPVMQLAVQSLMTQKPDIMVIALNWLGYLYENYPDILTSKRPEKHSGEGETARMLATHPELVEMERAQVYYPDAEADKKYGHPPGVYKTMRSMKEVTPVGSMGNPALAAADTGEKIYDLVVRWLADAIKQQFPPRS
jgi:creatinine amidohydrolase